MPLSDCERDLYLSWYRTTHFALPVYSDRLDAALARFRAIFAHDDPISCATATIPPLDLLPVMEPTITHF
jgi:hypothetical protein